MSLKDIFCQDKAINILQKAYAADRVAHAYIFAGPEGVGKFKTAREFARLLLCRNPVVEKDFSDSCGKCESCRLLESGAHPDFHHVYKELLQFTEGNEKKKTPLEFAIDVIREFVIARAKSKPGLSERKVFILSEAEKLNDNSQNCLLKVLEEPPPYCCIILVCTRLDTLVATIKSRCQIVRFGPVAEDRIIEKLDAPGLGQQSATFFARLAEGSIGLACQWANLEIAGANLYQMKTDIVDSLANARYGDCLDLAQRFISESKKAAGVWEKLSPATSASDIKRRCHKIILQIITSALHDAMVSSVKHDCLLVNSDQKEQIKALARRFDPEQAAGKIAECFRAAQWVESAVNERLIFERLLLNLADSDTIAA